MGMINDDVASFAIDVAINTIETNNIDDFMEKKNSFILDVKNFVRLCKHHGNLRASVSEAEAAQYYHILKHCVEKRIIESYWFRNVVYECIALNHSDKFRVKIIKRRK